MKIKQRAPNKNSKYAVAPEKVWTVLWHDEVSNGYTDFLPEEWFLKEGAVPGCAHKITGPHSGAHEAKCDVKVRGAYADLDYEAYAKYNRSRGMLLGVLRLQFESNQRKHITQVYWKDEESNRFDPESTTVGHERLSEDNQPQDIDITSAHEGDKKYVTHLRRERSPKLVAAKKASVLKASGTLDCEVCGFNFKAVYGKLGASYCEVHHRLALAKSGSKHTNLNDLAILCSNCHRMIHQTDPLLSVENFKKAFVKKRHPSHNTCPVTAQESADYKEYPSRKVK